MQKKRVVLVITESSDLDSVLTGASHQTVGNISINLLTDGSLARDIE